MFKIALNSEHIVHLKIHINWNPTFTKYKIGRKDHYSLNFVLVFSHNKKKWDAGKISNMKIEFVKYMMRELNLKTT